MGEESEGGPVFFQQFAVQPNTRGVAQGHRTKGMQYNPSVAPVPSGT